MIDLSDYIGETVTIGGLRAGTICHWNDSTKTITTNATKDEAMNILYGRSGTMSAIVMANVWMFSFLLFEQYQDGLMKIILIPERQPVEWVWRDGKFWLFQIYKAYDERGNEVVCAQIK